MLEIKEIEKWRFEVWKDGWNFGWIKGGTNPFHAGNCYLQLHLREYDERISRELFKKIQDIVKLPLQIMAESSDQQLISTIEAGGFQCRRKCYERTVCRAGFQSWPVEEVTLRESAHPAREYGACCRILYEQYRKKHEAVNPLTADFGTFLSVLPQTALYEQEQGEIINFTFVEENEIAYVGSTCRQRFPRFISNVVARLFGCYETISFESDDTDWEAMQLKALFTDNEDGSFDTYVLDY